MQEHKVTRVRPAPIKALFVLGTRPEAIKLAPVIAEFRRRSTFRVHVCVTAQHRELLDEVLRLFRIRPRYDLNIMRENQSLSDMTARLLSGISAVLKKESPDVVLVQGDTTTALAGALASFYRQVPVAHIEAGLRTFDLTRPFPEELNRRMIGTIAEFHFPPTAQAERNLLREGVARKGILVTGNTVIDALQSIRKRSKGCTAKRMRANDKILLVTAHRRESFGTPLKNVFQALREIAGRHPDVTIVFPVHPNPNVLVPARAMLGAEPRIRLVAPLNYRSFVQWLGRCYFVLSDSGGIQEEAPTLGKPVLVLRDTTERPEALRAGTACLVGTDPARIVRTAERLLTSPAAYHRMAQSRNPFGDGRASVRIADFLEYKYDRRNRPPAGFKT